MLGLEESLNEVTIDYYNFRDSKVFLENGVDYQTIILLGMFDKHKVSRVGDALKTGFLPDPVLVLSHGLYYNFDYEVETITDLLNNKQPKCVIPMSISASTTISALEKVSEPSNVLMLVPWFGYSSLTSLMKYLCSIYSTMQEYHLKKNFLGVPIDQLKPFLARDDFENKSFVEKAGNYLKCHNINAVLFSTDKVVNVEYEKMILSELEVPFEVIESKPGIYIHGAVVPFEELRRCANKFLGLSVTM